jgi:hypothetical protein
VGTTRPQAAKSLLLALSVQMRIPQHSSGTPTPITSLQYFADTVGEVKESATTESRWEPAAEAAPRFRQHGLALFSFATVVPSVPFEIEAQLASFRFFLIQGYDCGLRIMLAAVW